MPEDKYVVSEKYLPSPFSPRIREVFVLLLSVSAIVPTLLFLWMSVDLIRYALPELSWSYLVGSPANSGLEGGIGPILVSTGWVLLCAMTASLPIGIAVALLLSERMNLADRRARRLRLVLVLLAGMPSVVFGLMGEVLFGEILGLGTSILAGGMTLALMVLPTFVFALTEVLRLLPWDIRLAGAALGADETTIMFRLVLRFVRPGVAGAFLLASGRALGETAALIFTSGYSDRMPQSVFDPGRVLSIHILDLSLNIPGGEPKAAAAAVTLMALFLLFSGGVALLGTNFGAGGSYAR